MSLIESVSNPLAKAEVDQTNQALRISLRPHEYRGIGGTHIGGHFRRILTTGATTVLAAGAPMLSWRWTNSDRSFILNRIRAWATIGTAFTTAQEVSVDYARVTNFTAPDTAGTLIELGDDTKKMRAGMRGSLMSSLRVCTNVALTPGTGVEEPPMGGAAFAGLVNVVGAMGFAPVYDNVAGFEHPLTLSNLEGVRIRNRTVQGAVGVVVYTFEIDWSEVATSLLTPA